MHSSVLESHPESPISLAFSLLFFGLALFFINLAVLKVNYFVECLSIFLRIKSELWVLVLGEEHHRKSVIFITSFKDTYYQHGLSLLMLTLTA